MTTRSQEVYCLHDFQIRIARLKVSRGDFYGLVGIVAAPDQFSARRRHQCVVLGWLDERKVSANIAPHIGRGRFCCALNERGKFLVGDAFVRHVFTLPELTGVGRRATGAPNHDPTVSSDMCGVLSAELPT